MALKQRFGIKYPFSSDNLEEIYVDLNDTYTDRVKSEVLHVLFTPKGQKVMSIQNGIISLKTLPKGIYIIKTSSNTYKVSNK